MLEDLAGSPEVRKFVAERIYISANEACPQHQLLVNRGQILEHFDHAARSLVFTLDTYIHGITNEKLSIHRRWPKTWWDAFKLRWFPLWLRNRFPVEWERIDIDQKIFLAVCPHVYDQPQQTHLTWMAVKSME